MCAADNCPQPDAHLGLCSMHYQQQRRDRPPDPNDPQVQLFLRIAGDGNLDERCHNILKACRRAWW